MCNYRILRISSESAYLLWTLLLERSQASRYEILFFSSGALGRSVRRRASCRAGRARAAAAAPSRANGASTRARAAKNTQGPGRAAYRDRGVNGRRPRRRRRVARGVRADRGRAQAQAQAREEAACDLPRLRGLRL